MSKCKHKTKYIEKVQGNFGVNYGWSHGFSSFNTLATNSHIDTYCADCGELLKRVEIHDYVPVPKVKQLKVKHE